MNIKGVTGPFLAKNCSRSKFKIFTFLPLYCSSDSYTTKIKPLLAGHSTVASSCNFYHRYAIIHELKSEYFVAIKSNMVVITSFWSVSNSFVQTWFHSYVPVIPNSFKSFFLWKFKSCLTKQQFSKQGLFFKIFTGKICTIQ